jgi:hypothetical protein
MVCFACFRKKREFCQDRLGTHNPKEDSKQTVSARVCSVAVQSVNFNPLGAMLVTCPPTDWRSPPVIDGYNDALAEVTAAAGVPFIDAVRSLTRWPFSQYSILCQDRKTQKRQFSQGFIVGPMWDSADDWCHYHGKVVEAVAHYSLYRIAQLRQCDARLGPTPRTQEQHLEVRAAGAGGSDHGGLRVPKAARWWLKDTFYQDLWWRDHPDAFSPGAKLTLSQFSCKTDHFAKTN